jgi:AmmeMemoRadiSam system protein A
MLNTSEHYLTPSEEAILLRIARDSLEAWVKQHKRTDLSSYPLMDTLREKHGAFVTLRLGGELRGCVGYTANQAPLAAAVQDNAINAASRDLRFAPVTPEELEGITIEVSALTPGDTPETPFRRIHNIEEIVIGHDGLYIERPPARGGLLLPQVAVEEAWSVTQFLAAVCRKAGYPDAAWRDPAYRLYRFSAQVFSEPRPDHP